MKVATGVAIERSGFRCEDISRRHRFWGRHCPALDLDFVLLEYDLAKPIALIEYKLWNALPVDATRPNYQALINLADNYSDDGLPCFVARYNPAKWTFVIEPLNTIAHTKFKGMNGRTLSEQEFVRILYWLRGRRPTADEMREISLLSSRA